MKTRSTLALTALIISPLTAAITPFTEDFSSGAGSLTGWTDIGATATAIQYSSSASDGDAGTYDPVNTDGPGDGTAADGALLFNSQNATQGDEEIAYTFGGTMALDEAYTLDIAVFNGNGSYQRYAVSLWNKTDDVQIATTPLTNLNGGLIGCLELQLSFVPGLSDVGDELELRILEDHDTTARDVFVDSVSLTVDSAPATVGPYQVADLRLDAADFAGSITYFDPGFGPLTTRTAPSMFVNVPCTFSGTSSRAGNAPPDSSEDIGLQTSAATTDIRQISRGTVDPDGLGGDLGPQQLGIVEWKLDLTAIETYLSATGRHLDSLDLRLVTDPSDDSKTHNVYLSYTLPAEGMTLTQIDAADEGLNYFTFWLPAHYPTLANAGDLVNGTHKAIAINAAGNLDETTDLRALFDAGVREVTLLMDSGDYLQNRTTKILAGSGLSFTASIQPAGIVAVSEDFSSGAASLVGWTSSGSVDTVIAYTTNTNDSDNANYDTVNADSGGDDNAGDGGLLFDSQNATLNDEQISYVFDGLMDLSETYTVDISCYNPTNNYNSYKVMLWNKTDDVLLADSGGLIGLGSSIQGCRDTQVSYTPKLSDQGDILELRILENHNNTGRDVAIDSFSLTIGTPPADTGLLQLADLRLPAGAYSGAVTYFDPGFGPEATRSDTLDSAPFDVPTSFQGTSQNPGGASPDSGTDIGIQTYNPSTAIQQLNRFTSSADGGTSGPGRTGMVQWTIDLGQIADYLTASGKQLDTLDLALLTDPSDDAAAYDIYLSYNSAADAINLTDISTDNADANYDNLFWPSQGASDGDLIGTTHKVLKAGYTGNLTLTTDLAPLLNSGVREVNLILASGAFLSGKRISILEGSKVTFQASTGTGGTPFETFMVSYPDLTGADALAGADPDFDGVSNLAEFIMGGTAPNDGSAVNRPVDGIISDHLTVSVLVPSGASFTGTPSPSATVEGINVTASGSLDLATFNRNVEETTPNPDLPGAPGGYAWHTFRLADTVPSQTTGFLRLSFEQP